MPLRRNLESSRFKDAIRECFLEDYQRLLEVKNYVFFFSFSFLLDWG